MLIKTIVIYEQTCRLCGHVWDTRNPKPTECPRCKRRDWNRETKPRKYERRAKR